MNKNTIVFTRSKESSKDTNNLQSRKIVQDKIEEDKKRFLADGGEIQQLADFGIMPTEPKGYKGT